MADKPRPLLVFIICLVQIRRIDLVTKATSCVLFKTPSLKSYNSHFIGDEDVGYFKTFNLKDNVKQFQDLCEKDI